MWTDNETNLDFLNFTGIARTVAEIIRQAQSRPVSIGISGAWGVGKSSMIKLIKSELAPSTEKDKSDRDHRGEFVFVEFNAWLYQGYDDARAALLEVVATTLAKEAKERNTAVDKAKSFLKRVNWFRAAKLSATSLVSLALGLPPTGLVGEMVAVVKSLIGGSKIDEKVVAQGSSAIGKSFEAVSSIFEPESSPPKQIEALRTSFAELLKEMKVTLVVLIDDLDRCLPETAVATLEAIRLLLFLEHTAFVIAADDQMIKHAVKKHFEGVDDELAVNYFDKLIQVPIRVPRLGTQEVRAYMMLLHIDNSGLTKKEKETLRVSICDQLSRTWQGARVDIKAIESLKIELPPELIARLDAADRLAPLMTSATRISGNPRLIKRFLNASAIRMAMAKAQGVGVDEQDLAKMLLFERCGNPRAYSELLKHVSESGDGKPRFLEDWENKAISEAETSLPAPWDDPFIQEWLRLPPRLADRDLRGALYVSREHSPVINPQDRLSPEAAKILSAILTTPDAAEVMKPQLRQLPFVELSILMDRFLERALQDQEWGVPASLEACLAVVSVDPSQGARLCGFLRERPVAQIKANIIPRIADEEWAKELLDFWSNHSDIEGPVKNSIATRRKR